MSHGLPNRGKRYVCVPDVRKGALADVSPGLARGAFPGRAQGALCSQSCASTSNRGDRQGRTRRPQVINGSVHLTVQWDTGGMIAFKASANKSAIFCKPRDAKEAKQRAFISSSLAEGVQNGRSGPTVMVVGRMISAIEMGAMNEMDLQFARHKFRRVAFAAPFVGAAHIYPPYIHRFPVEAPVETAAQRSKTRGAVCGGCPQLTSFSPIG